MQLHDKAFRSVEYTKVFPETGLDITLGDDQSHTRLTRYIWEALIYGYQSIAFTTKS